MCHLVLLMPVLGLATFWIFPLWIALPAYVIVLIMSVVAYEAMIRSMNAPILTGSEGMMGALGKVVGHANRGLQVSVQGELWNAISTESLQKGQRVRVVGIHGLSLDVERVRKSGPGTTSRCH